MKSIKTFKEFLSESLTDKTFELFSKRKDKFVSDVKEIDGAKVERIGKKKKDSHHSVRVTTDELQTMQKVVVAYNKYKI